MILDGIEKGQNKTQNDFIKEALYKAASRLNVNKQNFINI